MPHLSNFQALLFDADRTLVDYNYEFPEGVIEALHQLRQKNFIIGVCTGRAFQSVQDSILPVFLEIDREAFHIISGGAEIINSQGEVFFQQSIPPEVVRNLIRDRQSGPRFLASSHFNIYMDDDHLQHYQNKWDRQILPLSQYEDEPITLINVHDVNPNNQFLANFKDQLQIKYMVSNDGVDYAEITALGVNKATGLAEWSRLTGVPAEKIIGFGDNHNDLEFLQAVGFSVAMGNAVDELKQVADKVIGHVSEGGLRVYLESLLAGEKL
jgi:Cof subfamily protein (haloacid dehalogenase superfamily)